MGFSLPDVRFSSSASATAAAGVILFPVRVIVRRPNAAQALSEARDAVTRFASGLAALSHPGATLRVAEPGETFEGRSPRVGLDQRGKSEVELDLEAFAVLRLADAPDFWARAAAVAWAADAVQAFAQASHPKRVWAVPRRARFAGEPVPAGEEDRPLSELADG